MTTLTVGSGKQYATIGAALAVAKDGDIVEVSPGTYLNESASINTKITVRGVGGMPKLDGNTNIANGKGYICTNTDCVIENLEFANARVADANGCGVRYQNGKLTINNCLFHGNQNGILGNNLSATIGDAILNNCEFYGNGIGDGHTHQIYFGFCHSLLVNNCLFRDNGGPGHHIKSRAANTTIKNTRVFENNDATSYAIDFPSGGVNVIDGCVVQQSKNGSNSNIFAAGEEGVTNPANSLTVTNSTVLNDMDGRGNLFLGTLGTVSYTNNKWWALNALSGVPASGWTKVTTRPTLNTVSPISGTPIPAPPPPPPVPAPPPAPPPPPPPSTIKQIYIKATIDLSNNSISVIEAGFVQ